MATWRFEELFAHEFYSTFYFFKKKQMQTMTIAINISTYNLIVLRFNYARSAHT